MKTRLLGMMVLAALGSFTASAQTAAKPAVAAVTLKLPDGFKAVVMAKDLGNARHIAVNGNGDVYIKMGNAKGNKAIIKLKDTNGDGVADEQTAFGNYGGTGIAIKNGYLYASSNTSVYRYKLNADQSIVNTDAPELIVKGLLDKGQHNSKSIALDNAGNLYVNIGAYSNSCQIADRNTGSLGQDPCPILDSAGGIWQFKADKLNQTYGDGIRYATGLRNVVGLDWNNEVNELYVMQHGRDQIASMFPNIYKESEGAELPAEEFFEVKKGTNAGWPYCYYNPITKQKLLNPEYGGDGKTVGRCDIMQKPLVGFPAHMAPNGLLFYTGTMFPEKYRNGAFIAFHGSWNRSPQKQEGFYVVFQPMKDGKPNGEWEVFADGFKGKDVIMSPGQAMYRPCGLAQGPDGALYITDDAKGTVWKVSYGK